MEFDSEGEEGRNKRFSNGIWSFVVSFNCRELFKVMSDSPPKLIVLFLIRIEELEYIKMFCEVEISKGQISKSKLFLSNKCFKCLKFRLNLG
jgi:hypothetical protein